MANAISKITAIKQIMIATNTISSVVRPNVTFFGISLLESKVGVFVTVLESKVGVFVTVLESKVGVFVTVLESKVGVFVRVTGGLVLTEDDTITVYLLWSVDGKLD